jgi:NAD(P)-dependent dehydrogenase (short-subunit alcohol dehydrogenase family)
MLAAHYLTAMWVLKYITLEPGARAVFFGAYPQYVRVPGFAAYAAAKAALEAYVETARKEFQRQGAQLIVVRMPAVATGLWAPLGGAPKNALSPAEAARRVLQSVRSQEAPDLVEV